MFYKLMKKHQFYSKILQFIRKLYITIIKEYTEWLFRIVFLQLFD